jgi:hypothetical protein
VGHSVEGTYSLRYDKKANKNMGTILNGYERRIASRNTRPCTVPAGTRTVSGSSNWQLATRTVHNRAAEWVAAGGGIFENLLTPQVSVN